ncbi:hypothetical protein D3C87_2152830 [compost metagenome]
MFRKLEFAFIEILVVLVSGIRGFQSPFDQIIGFFNKHPDKNIQNTVFLLIQTGDIEMLIRHP